VHLRIAGVARRNIMVDTQKSCQLAGIACDHLTWPPCCVELTRGALVPTFSNWRRFRPQVSIGSHHRRSENRMSRLRR